MAKCKSDAGGRTWFFCPGCQFAHRIDGNWIFNGDLQRPTIRPSILVKQPHPEGDRICHSFVTAGRIQFLGDCTHDLKGKTVELPECPSST